MQMGKGNSLEKMQKFLKKMSKITLILLFLGIDSLFSQEKEPNAQILIDKFDYELSYPQGISKGKWVKKKGNTTISERDFRIYKFQEEFLYEIDRSKGELGFRLLCKKSLKASEREIYFTKIPSIRLQKVSLETRREFQPEFGFSFEELCQFPYQSYYTPSKVETYQNLKIDYWKTEVTPLEKYEYSKLFLYSFKSNSYPYRIDFYDANEIHQRIAKFREKEIIFKYLSGKSELKKRIAVYSMNDLDTNIVYYLELSEVITDPILPQEVLKMENLSRTKN
jgi:hypothetical protein